MVFLFLFVLLTAFHWLPIFLRVKLVLLQWIPSLGPLFYYSPTLDFSDLLFHPLSSSSQKLKHLLFPLPGISAQLVPSFPLALGSNVTFLGSFPQSPYLKIAIYPNPSTCSIPPSLFIFLYNTMTNWFGLLFKIAVPFSHWNLKWNPMRAGIFVCMGHSRISCTPCIKWLYESAIS